jgi:hypothetical protein
MKKTYDVAVKVALGGGEHDSKTIAAKNIIVATGSRPMTIIRPSQRRSWRGAGRAWRIDSRETPQFYRPVRKSGANEDDAGTALCARCRDDWRSNAGPHVGCVARRRLFLG